MKFDSASLTNCQLNAIEVIRENQKVFLTGVAGTGKSYLINNLENFFPDCKIHKTATMGLTSLNINGKTISSFLGLGLYTEATSSLHCREWLDNTIIVIDEIQILSDNNFKNFVLKSILKNSEKVETVKIIICGDFAQMGNYDNDTEIDLTNFVKVELKEIKRQESAEFIKILTSVRHNGLTRRIINILKNKKTNLEKKGTRLVKDYYTKTLYDDQIVINPDDVIFTHTWEYPHGHKLYENLVIYKGMRVMITRNCYEYGSLIYANGDTGIVVGISHSYRSYRKPYIEVLLDRTEETVLVKFELYQTDNIDFDEKNYEKNIELDNTLHKQYYDGEIDYDEFSEKLEKLNIYLEKFKDVPYIPLISSDTITVRKSIGSTISKGIIDKSILNSDDNQLIYTALSRFKSIEDIYFDFEENEVVEFENDDIIEVEVIDFDDDDILFTEPDTSDDDDWADFEFNLITFDKDIEYDQYEFDEADDSEAYSDVTIFLDDDDDYLDNDDILFIKHFPLGYV